MYAGADKTPHAKLTKASFDPTAPKVPLEEKWDSKDEHILDDPKAKDNIASEHFSCT